MDGIWGRVSGPPSPRLCVERTWQPKAACSCVVSQGERFLMLHLRCLHHQKRTGTETHTDKSEHEAVAHCAAFRPLKPHEGAS